MGIVWSAWAMMLVDIDEQMRQRHLAEFGVDSPKTEKLVFGTIPRESKYEAHSELGAWLLAIPENSEQSDLALEFIEYAADLGKYSNSGHVRSLTAARSGTPPPRQSVLAELENQTKFSEWHPSLFAAIRSSLDEKFSRARPRTACWKEIESRLGSYLEKSIDQEIAAKDIPSEANQNLRVLFDDKKCREFLQSQSAHGPAVYAASQSKVLRREVANILPH
jgi:ABC-type glycerol-3-phosphate transport system substrate-binding protein